MTLRSRPFESARFHCDGQCDAHISRHALASGFVDTAPKPWASAQRLMNRTRHESLRRGLTLYEVVLSLAILLGSMAVLGQLIATGSRAATQAKLRTEAMLLCQTKLAEVVAGAAPLVPVEGELLEENATGRWVWSLEVAGGQSAAGQSAIVAGAQQAVPPHPDLLQLEVTVSRINADGSVEASGSLSRFLRNPALYVEAANEAAALESQAQAAE